MDVITRSWDNFTAREIIIRKRKSVKLVAILSMDFTTPTAIIRLFVSWIIRKNLVNARDVMDILREIF